MKKQYLLFIIICLALPILLRGLWFYQGLYFPYPPVKEPDYSNFSIPQPVLSTQPVVEAKTVNQKISVLFDLAHTNRFGMAEIDILTNSILSLGAGVQTDTDGKDLQSKLQTADAYVVIAPTVSFSKENIQTIKDFTSRGGHLLIVADPTRTYQNYYFDVEESVLIANQVLEPYGIAFITDYVYSITHNEGNFRNIYALPATQNSLTKNIKQMVFYGSHSISGNLVPLLKGDISTLSSSTDKGGELNVAAISHNGNIIALGDMGFFVSPYDQVVDNYQFVLNIAEFLAGNARQRSIADFPNLFTRPLVVLQNKEINLDKYLLVELSNLQAKYKANNIPVSITDQPQENKDLLILGVYPPSEDLKKYVASFGINFNASPISTSIVTLTPTPISNDYIFTATPEVKLPQINHLSSSDYFSIPGLGLIPSKGFNLVLYNQNADSNTLILLTESNKNLVDLLKLVNNGSLKDCLTQAQIAVCAGGFVSKDSTSPTVPTPTPIPTPTYPASSTTTPAG
jgi:hypothetical protein